MYDLAALIILVVLGSRSPILLHIFVITPNGNPVPLSMSFLCASLGPHLPSVSTNLSLLDISCTWSHPMPALLWLTSFTLRNVFEVHPCVLEHNSLFFFFLWLNNTSCVVDYIVCIHLFVGGHLGCYHFLAVGNSASTNIGVQACTWVPVPRSRSGICWVTWSNESNCVPRKR